MEGAPSPSASLAVALVLLVLLAVGAAAVGGMRIKVSLVAASLRAIVQLAVVSLAIAAVLLSLEWSFAFGVLMFVVAAWTSSRRTKSPRDVGWVGLAMAAGVLPVLTLLFVSGTIPLNGKALIPTASIIIGNTMTACTLAGRRAFDELQAKIGTFEAALAVGLQRRDAILEVISPTSPEALTPVLDTTRTVGLVTLPGAYIGVLLGGGSPWEAGAAQIMVLIGLLASETVAVVVLTRLIARSRVLPRVLRMHLAA